VRQHYVFKVKAIFTQVGNLMSDEFEKLDGQESAILNKRGWFLVTYFQTRDGDTKSNSYNLALEKARSINRQTGIRTRKKDNYTMFEVWEKW